MSGLRNARHEDSTSSSDEELARFPSRRQVCAFEEDHEMCLILFSQRTKGPSHPGLASLRPSNERYDRLISYRHYRIRRTSHSRNSASTLRLHKLIKNLDLTFKEDKFAGTDLILIFDFLTRFVEECDTLDMSEAQAFMSLPRVLQAVAQAQDRAIQNGWKSGDFSYCPEAVQYLLYTYATPAAIMNAM